MTAPAFANEAELERYVREVIQSRVTTRHPHIYTLENKKAVDILICRDGPDPALFFLEVKFHRHGHGRLGFGSGNGRGFQPEILQRKPAYFERNMRWVLASETHEPDKIRLLTSADVRKYVAGGVIGQKFNNLQTRLWRESPYLSHGDFASELEAWVR
ncbi:MAG: hypothetical protein JSR79_13870 [Proteobacteria bacterium]|nr:hypothetical protein [Pseudomonadota bacterium]